MTLLEKLQSHRGGLLRLKTELYWYDVGDWDNNPGRVCLVLDATVHAPGTDAATVRADGLLGEVVGELADVLLLVDGSPQWVWVAECDVEVIDEAR